MPKRRVNPVQTPLHSDSELRLFVYRFLLRTGRAPLIADMEEARSWTPHRVRAALARLSESHAFMTQSNGELWRVAPFSVVPTSFPVKVQKRSYWGNCIWDALGIPAMLNRDAEIGACCGCCNLSMPLHVRRGKLVEKAGVIHIGVPARDWYKDVVFT
jgi:Alkylmercury lyase